MNSFWNKSDKTERRSSHQSRGERRSRPERRSRFDEERSFERSDRPKRSFGEVRFGRSRFDDKPRFGEKRRFRRDRSEDRPFDRPKRSFGEHNEDRDSFEKRSFEGDRPFNKGRSFGKPRFSDSGSRRPFREKRDFRKSVPHRGRERFHIENTEEGGMVTAFRKRQINREKYGIEPDDEHQAEIDAILASALEVDEEEPMEDQAHGGIEQKFEKGESNAPFIETVPGGEETGNGDVHFEDENLGGYPDQEMDSESFEDDETVSDEKEKSFDEPQEQRFWRKKERSHRPFPKPIKPMAPRYLRSDNPAPEGSENWQSPWAQMRTYSFSPCVFPAMIGVVSQDAKPGDWVKVYDREGNPFGAAFYNPKAKVPLRVYTHGDVQPGDDILTQAIDKAIELRHEILHLPERTNAYRIINSDGDGLSGLIVDRYADVLSLEVHSLGIFLRLNKILAYLHERLGTRYEVVQVDDKVRHNEGIKNVPKPSLRYNSVKILENGVKFEVDFSKGHKTGFFCDQRENRLKFSSLVKGKRILDLCCYTGGFSVMAGVLGGATDITGVDLDENAIEQAKRHANINGQNKIKWVHADAYTYARQMKLNNEKWDVILLDPPKFVESREEEFEGWGRYEDLNKLGISLLNPGGMLVTCSCSGLLSLNRFEDILIKAAHRNNRRLQIFDVTGAGGDHPIYSNCLESRYLKVLWTRVF